MSSLTVNGSPIVTATICLRQRGAWTADIEVGTDTDLGDDVTIESPTGSVSFTGFKYRSNVYGATVSARIVGGAGGLRNIIPAKGYSLTPALTVAQDIASACGETLAAESAAILSGAILTHWARAKGTAERALTALADELEAVWRMTPAGEILFTVDAFAEVESDGELLEDCGDDGEIVLGLSDFDPALQPGVSYDGRKIYSVTHHASEVLRTSLSFEGEDRTRGTIRRLVEASLPNDEYTTTQAGKVALQAGAKCDFIPENDTIPQMQRVPMFLGVPGLTIQLVPGARAQMGFHGRDPSKPYVLGFESGSLLSYSLTCPNITLGTSAALPIALAPPTIGGFAAIATYIAALTSALAANPSSYTPFAAAMAAPGATVAGALAGLAATVPSLTTKAT